MCVLPVSMSGNPSASWLLPRWNKKATPLCGKWKFVVDSALYLDYLSWLVGM